MKITKLTLLFMALFAFAGCSDDDDDGLGKLIVHFESVEAKVTVNVYSLEASLDGKATPLYSIPAPALGKQEASIRINAGNYFIKNASLNTTFQIREDKTTKLVFSTDSPAPQVVY